MNEYKNLYIPIFYNWRGITRSFSDREFGMLIRALMDCAEGNPIPPSLPQKLVVPFEFMIDGVERIIKQQIKTSELQRERVNKRWAKERSEEYRGIPSHTINTNTNTNTNANTNTDERSAVKSTIKFGDLDPDEAFQKALERSYGKG